MTQPVDQMSGTENQKWSSQIGANDSKPANANQPTDGNSVHGASKNELRRSVVPRANVGHVGLVGHQDLGGAKVAQLEDAGARVEKEVLGLDVTVADTERVDVGEGAEELVHVQLDGKERT